MLLIVRLFGSNKEGTIPILTTITRRLKEGEDGAILTIEKKNMQLLK